jgi:hypothetical protein
MMMENTTGTIVKCGEAHAVDDEVPFPDALYDAKVLALSISLHVPWNYAGHHFVYSQS